MLQNEGEQGSVEEAGRGGAGGLEELTKLCPQLPSVHGLTTKLRPYTH